MLKKILPLLVLLLLCSCSPGSRNTLSNTYMRLTVTPPVGYTVLEQSVVNLSAEAEDTADLSLLERQTYGDGNSYIELIRISNGKPEDDPEYIELRLFADEYQLSLSSLSAYVSACSDAYTGMQTDGYYSTKNWNENSTLLNDVRYRVLSYHAAMDGRASYQQKYYITDVEDLYFTAYLRYPVANSEARIEATSLLDCFQLDKVEPEEESEGTAAQTLTYYNDCFGFKVEADTASFNLVVNDSNISTSPEEKVLPSVMERQSYPDDGGYYDLVKVSTLGIDTAVLDIYADDYPMFESLEEYLEAVKQAYGSLQTEEEGTLNGVEYVNLAFMNNTSCDIMFIKQVDGLYFVIHLQYNTGSDKSIDDAAKLMETLTVYEPGGLK